MKKAKPISTGNDWNFPLLEKYYNVIEKIAVEELGLKTFPNQIEVITSEQMLDCYSSVGLPLNYGHWSFGKKFVEESEAYKKGRMGLAYEIVINSNPSIAYLMEENDLLMQVLVMAHACFGHNAFFANNYLFRQWTQPEAIIDYMNFAKKYIAQCEERYGYDEVEETLDACHALQYYGVDKYKKPRKLSAQQEQERQAEREAYRESRLNEIWNSIEKKPTEVEKSNVFPSEPQENLLYFIEKNAPNLPTWKREIVRIVRKISQYFYPQMQTKVSNEGFATFTHHYILNRLHDQGYITDGHMLNFIQNHTAVVYQRQHSAFNPYALGFAIYKDIERICRNPTDEDRDWFPSFAGNPDFMSVIRDAMMNYRDESFIQQFLSPKVMRDMGIFSLYTNAGRSYYEVTAIHDESGYKKVRSDLARQYDISYLMPQIEVAEVDRWGDRSLRLVHTPANDQLLDTQETLKTLAMVHRLWGYRIKLDTHSDHKDISQHFVYPG